MSHRYPPHFREGVSEEGPSFISGGAQASHLYRPPFPGESMRRIDTLLHIWRKARVTSIPSSISGGGRASCPLCSITAQVMSIPSSISRGGRASCPLCSITARVMSIPSSISGGGHASHRYPPPFPEEGARHVDILLHFWRRARIALIPGARVASLLSSISGGGRVSR